MKYYAVRIGRNPGVYTTWDACKSEIHRYPGGEFKSFSQLQQAKDWLEKREEQEETKYSLKSEERDYSGKQIVDDEEDVIHVFTDGACSNNGKHNAKAGLGVYFGEDDPRNFSGAIFGKQTNNTAEVKAVIKAYKILEQEIKDGKRVNIYSDSSYTINAATTRGEKLEKGGWLEDIPNKNLVKKLYTLFKDRDNVKFFYVKAHTKLDDWISKGNEGADELARNGILHVSNRKEM